MISVIPLSILDCVRNSWETIVSLIGNRVAGIRQVQGDSDDFNRRRMIRFDMIRPVIVGIQDLNMIGSKEEKMSGIIQASGCPIGDFEGP